MKKVIPFLIVLILAASCKKDFRGSVYNIQPTDVTRTSITCGGYIDVAQGDPNIISCGIAYSLDSGYTYEGTHVPADSIVQKGAFKCTMTDLIPDTTCYLTAYFETSDGFQYAYSDEMIVQTEYSVGNSGPAGGLIISLMPDGLHGTEISTHDLGKATWGCSGTDISNANALFHGFADENTLEILANCSDNTCAAALCANYSFNGFEDWYLPTSSELISAYQNVYKKDKGNFTHGYDSYWSSVQYNANNAWIVHINDGGLYWTNKTSLSPRVRAIRYF
jgi:hypothetical protein